MNILGGDGAYGCLAVDAEIGSSGEWGPCHCAGLGRGGGLGHVSGLGRGMQFCIENRYVAWMGQGVGSNNSARRLQVNKGGSYLPCGL